MAPLEEGVGLSAGLLGRAGAEAAGVSGKADDAAHEALCAQIQARQRASRQGRLQWHYFCDTYGQGVRSPFRQPAAFLQQFLDAVDRGSIPDISDDPHLPGKPKKVVKLFAPGDAYDPLEVGNATRTEAAETPEAPHTDAPPAVTGDFVLLAAFDGIRGCSVALRTLGVEPLADYSAELDAGCQRLIAAKFPKCVQLGDVKKITQQRLEEMVVRHGRQTPWLVVGGSPCQDLSCRRGAKARGLEGTKSKLFYEFVRIVNTLLRLDVQVAFLLENVASMPDSQRDAMSAALGVAPLDIDAAAVSACHRRRYYWTNLAAAPPEAQAVDVDSMLDPGWRRDPPGKPFRCLVASAAFQVSRGRGELGVVREADGAERALNAGERERILGFPRGHTRLCGDGGEALFVEAQRWKMLGNSFSVQVVARLLQPVAEAVRGRTPWELRALDPQALVLTMNRLLEDEGGEDEEPAADMPWLLDE